MNKMRICIEGNIGVGKTETLKILKNRGFDICTEPVECWNLLENFYENKKYAFPFQMQVLASFCKPSNLNSEISFQERNAKSGVRVFSAMLRDEKNMSDLQFSILCAAFLELNYEPPDLIIFLDLNSETCLKRIKERSRMNEHVIDLTYLEKVKNYYEQYLSEEEGLIQRIDCNEKTPECIADEILLKIENLVDNLKNIKFN